MRLMPWQQLVADVGMELDASGRPAYREVIVTVPRQSGKTTLVLSWEVDRCLNPAWGPLQRVAYTAQTGFDARKKLIDDQVPILTRSKLNGTVDQVHRANGREAVTFSNGSRIEVMATSESAGHGRVVSLGVIDEAFSDLDDRREQALLPAMATKANGQLLVVSTAGTDASLYLLRKVEAGRLAVESDADSGIAYFEWSAPDSADADDEDVWLSCMPALGHTIDLSVVRHARQTMSDGEFRRAYLNQWTSANDRVIPESVWLAVCDLHASPAQPSVFAVDVNPERSAASIATSDGSAVELIEHRPGVGWVVDRLVELVERWRVPVALDTYGPAASLVEHLEMRGVTVERCAGREFAAACGAFYDAVLEGRVRLRAHHALDVAAAGAKKRKSGDAWTWARRDTSMDVSPLIAATVAYAKAQNRTGAQAPSVVSLADL